MKCLKVKSQSQPVQVQSQREESGQTLMSTLLATEIHPEPGQQFSIALFGKRAEVQYKEGDLLLAALNFQIRQGSAGTYQAVYAEELIKVERSELSRLLKPLAPHA